jgi:hypothetical protein
MISDNSVGYPFFRSIYTSVVSVPSVANGFWLRLRRAVSSVAEQFQI